MMKIVFAILLGFLLLPVASPAARQSPVDSGIVTSGVGWRLDPFGSGRLVYHSGYDIAVPVGTPVHPTQTGTVFFSGSYRGYGNLVGIDHGNGYLTYYGHNSVLLVKPGEKVDTETVIALSGSTGRSTGPHVHYEMRRMHGNEGLLGKPLENTAGDLARDKGSIPSVKGADGMWGRDDSGLLLPEGTRE
jgi:murein DD-endopeptidase MepM/ murein hydrolase activator NlpD